jgi:hypothetical protein
VSVNAIDLVCTHALSDTVMAAEAPAGFWIDFQPLEKLLGISLAQNTTKHQHFASPPFAALSKVLGMLSSCSMQQLLASVYYVQHMCTELEEILLHGMRLAAHWLEQDDISPEAMLQLQAQRLQAACAVQAAGRLTRHNTTA